MTFEELARLTGEQLRHVEVDLDAEDVALIRQLPGYTDFNPRTETLQMLKAVYGLKDAPRAWRRRLHQVLTEFRLTPLIAEAELYIRHLTNGLPSGAGKSGTRLVDLHSREDAAREEREHSPQFAPLQSATLNCIIINTRVDDRKGNARPKPVQLRKAHLWKQCGEGKLEKPNLVHIGTEHIHS